MADPQAAQLGQWFDAHAAALRLYARQWLDEATAADVVQEAFLRLLGQRPAPNHVRAWLCQVVRRLAVDQHRGGQRRSDREQAVGSRRGEWLEARREPGVDPRAAQAALARLPLEQREVIVLRVWAELGFAAIAELVQAPLSTVFSRYQAGLAALRTCLEDASCSTPPPSRR